IGITDGKVHDVNMLDQILPEAGAFYVMDRGYVDFERLYVFTLSAAFFVVRTKSNVVLQRRYFASGGQDHRSPIRSHRHSDRHRLRQSVPGATAAHQLSGCRNQASVITSKPAINDHFKTGQGSRTQDMKLFYRAEGISGKLFLILLLTHRAPSR